MKLKNFVILKVSRRVSLSILVVLLPMFLFALWLGPPVYLYVGVFAAGIAAMILITMLKYSLSGLKKIDKSFALFESELVSKERVRVNLDREFISQADILFSKNSWSSETTLKRIGQYTIYFEDIYFVDAFFISIPNTQSVEFYVSTNGSYLKAYIAHRLNSVDQRDIMIFNATKSENQKVIDLLKSLPNSSSISHKQMMEKVGEFLK